MRPACRSRPSPGVATHWRSRWTCSTRMRSARACRRPRRRSWPRWRSPGRSIRPIPSCCAAPSPASGTARAAGRTPDRRPRPSRPRMDLAPGRAPVPVAVAHVRRRPRAARRTQPGGRHRRRRGAACARLPTRAPEVAERPGGRRRRGGLAQARRPAGRRRRRACRAGARGDRARPQRAHARRRPRRRSTSPGATWRGLSSDGGGPVRNAVVAALLSRLLPALEQFDAAGLAPFLPRYAAARCAGGAAGDGGTARTAAHDGHRAGPRRRRRAARAPGGRQRAQFPRRRSQRATPRSATA